MKVRDYCFLKVKWISDCTDSWHRCLSRSVYGCEVQGCAEGESRYIGKVEIMLRLAGRRLGFYEVKVSGVWRLADVTEVEVIGVII